MIYDSLLVLISQSLRATEHWMLLRSLCPMIRTMYSAVPTTVISADSGARNVAIPDVTYGGNVNEGLILHYVHTRIYIRRTR